MGQDETRSWVDSKGGVKLKAEPEYLHVKLAFWPSGGIIAGKFRSD